MFPFSDNLLLCKQLGSNMCEFALNWPSSGANLSVCSFQVGEAYFQESNFHTSSVTNLLMLEFVNAAN